MNSNDGLSQHLPMRTATGADRFLLENTRSAKLKNDLMSSMLRTGYWIIGV